MRGADRTCGSASLPAQKLKMHCAEWPHPARVSSTIGYREGAGRWLQGSKHVQDEMQTRPEECRVKSTKAKALNGAVAGSGVSCLSVC